MATPTPKSERREPNRQTVAAARRLVNAVDQMIEAAKRAERAREILARQVDNAEGRQR